MEQKQFLSKNNFILEWKTTLSSGYGDGGEDQNVSSKTIHFTLLVCKEEQKNAPECKMHALAEPFLSK